MVIMFKKERIKAELIKIENWLDAPANFIHTNIIKGGK